MDTIFSHNVGLFLFLIISVGGIGSGLLLLFILSKLFKDKAK